MDRWDPSAAAPVSSAVPLMLADFSRQLFHYVDAASSVEQALAVSLEESAQMKSRRHAKADAVEPVVPRCAGCTQLEGTASKEARAIFCFFFFFFLIPAP